jgi:hypothetical protein
MAPPYMTSALERGEWSASRLCCFTHGTHWIWGWVGSRAGLDAVEKRKTLPLPGIERRPSSPSLYCIVFLLLPFLLEHRASVKHFRFTSVS